MKSCDPCFLMQLKKLNKHCEQKEREIQEMEAEYTQRCVEDCLDNPRTYEGMTTKEGVSGLCVVVYPLYSPSTTRRQRARKLRSMSVMSQWMDGCHNMTMIVWNGRMGHLCIGGPHTQIIYRLMYDHTGILGRG